MLLTRTRLFVAFFSAALVCPLGARAQLQRSYQVQIEDARLPGHGELRVQVSANFENWSDQFARDNANWENGQRRPLSADYDGPIKAGYFPGLAPVLADLNSDAGALGFDPIAAPDFRQGKLDFGTVTASRHTFWLNLSLGLLDRFALELALPLVRTTADPSFSFNPTGSTMTTAASVVPDSVTFFGDYASAIVQLGALIDGGTLSPPDQMTAEALLATALDFGAALTRRVRGNLVMPLGGTTAGDQVDGRYASLESGFVTFGLTLPSFMLPTQTSGTDLVGFFTQSLVIAELLAKTTQGYALGEVEPALKVGVLDTFDEEEGSSLELRTAVQALVRIPTGAADQAPFLNPNNFVSLPIGDGQWDVELSLFQDVGIRWFLLNVAARYGRQLSDQLTLRIRSPGLRFALAKTEATVNRDLGDYFSLRLAPRVRLGSVVTVGAEYDYWQKGRDSYALVSTNGTAVNADPLEIHTGQTRHRLGISVTYSTLQKYREGAANFPVELWFVYQGSLAGGGGQTPASELASLSLLFPIKLF